MSEIERAAGEGLPTCGVLYEQSVEQFSSNDAERWAFAAGHVSGQAEKVYLGACKAAMFRPQRQHDGKLLGIVTAIAGRYGLAVQCFPHERNGEFCNEIWISRDPCDVGEWQKYGVNSHSWHELRGVACGVPWQEIDYSFHERRGYNEPCDGTPPAQPQPTLACHDCGRPYGDEHGFPDLVVPNDVWQKISPNGNEGGLLCPSCICKRLHDLGIECEGRFRSGPLCEFAQPSLDANVQAVIAKHSQRAVVGLRKYGVTTEALSKPDALRHLQEELLDAAVYCEQLMRAMSRRDRFDDQADEVCDAIVNNLEAPATPQFLPPRPQDLERAKQWAKSPEGQQVIAEAQEMAQPQPSERERPDDLPTGPGLWFEETFAGNYEGRYCYSDGECWRYLSGGSLTGLRCRRGRWLKAHPPTAELERLRAENDRLRTRLLIAAGDDLCRLTQEEIKAYSSGAVKIPPKEEFIASCERFHQQIAGEAGVLNGCLTLAQLIAENERLRVEASRLDIIRKTLPESWYAGLELELRVGYLVKQWRKLYEVIKELEQHAEAAEKFKASVHSYLDSYGVPHHPPGIYGADGCRIGDRMDWVFGRIEAAEARVAEDRKALQAALGAIDEAYLATGHIKVAKTSVQRMAIESAIAEPPTTGATT